MTISSIGVTGANAGDFAQTNTCPVKSEHARRRRQLHDLDHLHADRGRRRAAQSQRRRRRSRQPADDLAQRDGRGAGARASTLSPTSLAFGQQPVGHVERAADRDADQHGNRPADDQLDRRSPGRTPPTTRRRTLPDQPGDARQSGPTARSTVTFSPTRGRLAHRERRITDNAPGSAAQRQPDRHGHRAGGDAHAGEPDVREPGRGHDERVPRRRPCRTPAAAPLTISSSIGARRHERRRLRPDAATAR